MSDHVKHVLRFAAGGFFAAALRVHSRVYEPRGPVVIIAPHPDDETLGCGGVIALLARRGVPVHPVFLTDGEASHTAHPVLTAPTLGLTRKKEAQAALTVLGGPAVAQAAVFLGYPDGRLDRLTSAEVENLHAALVELLRRTKAVAVFAPYRFGGSTEHTAAYAFTRSACAAAGGAELLEYPIWAWWNPFRLLPQLRLDADNLCLPLDAPLRAAKRTALACHRSQVEPTPPWPTPLLPAAISRACLGRREYFFRQVVPSISLCAAHSA